MIFFNLKFQRCYFSLIDLSLNWYGKPRCDDEELKLEIHKSIRLNLSLLFWNLQLNFGYERHYEA